MILRLEQQRVGIRPPSSNHRPVAVPPTRRSTAQPAASRPQVSVTGPHLPVSAPTSGGDDSHDAREPASADRTHRKQMWTGSRRRVNVCGMTSTTMTSQLRHHRVDRVQRRRRSVAFSLSEHDVSLQYATHVCVMSAGMLNEGKGAYT